MAERARAARPGRVWSAACALGLALGGGAEAETLQLLELGPGPVAIHGIGNAELSGITWAGGTRYYAVDDGRSRLFPLEVTLDAESGAIVRIEAGEFVSLPGVKDAEGIAWRAATETVLVTDEGTNQIHEFDPTTGERKGTFPAPPFFEGRIRENKGFEGITLAPDGESAWLANEGPLRLDGDDPDALRGGLVRLQRLDAKLRPTGQWAYRTEAGLGFVGVVDLLVAPGGELLVLERALTGGGFSARVFLADLSNATDVSRFEKLRNRDDFRTVRKEKLFERSGGFQNFEGMALGPELPSGGRLVLVVSDGNDQRQPALIPLRLLRRGAAPTKSE